MNEKITNNYDLVITSKTFGLMRTELIKHLGMKNAKRFLLQLGKELGGEKAKDIFKNTSDLESLLKKAPEIHVSLGHISSIESIVTTNFNIEDGYFEHVKGIWHNSFEVPLHVDNFGVSDECICFILSGFASGILSKIHNQDIFVKEVTCKGKGDDYCSFEINTKEYWEKQEHFPLPIYDTQTIQNEFENTYDQLLEQKNLLKKVTDFHSRITNKIAKNIEISNLLNTSYEILNIPCFITDLNGEIQYQTNELSLDKNPFSKKTQKILRDFDQTSTLSLASKKLLVTPIFLDYKKIAYCFFLYNHPKQIDKDDYLYLERLAVAATLCFLNEKVSFEATERLKINFLDRLIHRQFLDISEINRHSKFISPKIKAPFITVAIKYHISNNLHFLPDTYQIILQLAKIFNRYNLHVLLSQKEDHIILLSYNAKNFIQLTNILKLATKELENGGFKLEMKAGISNIFYEIKDFYTALYEAEKAMKFPKNEPIINYNDIGFFGALLENFNPETLIEVAKKELGPLLDDNPKSKELLYTLYVFLKHNQNLDKTMHTLSLSIGGIRYRIAKIEKLLNKDLKDAMTFAHLLLLIEALILVNNISFK